jgi:hypothetical protein
MSTLVPFRRHPKLSDRFRSILALWSLPALLFGFLCILVLFAAVLAAFFRYAEDGDLHSYGFWLRQSVLLLSGLATTTTQSDETGVHAGAQLVAALGGLIIPALVLGTVVFKGFVKDRVFVTRAKLALLPPQAVTFQADDVYRWLAFRVYSSTRLQLVNLKFEAFARVVGESPTGTSTVTNVKLKLYKEHWPVALTHVPYTLYSPLRREDIDGEGEDALLVRVADENGNEHELDEGCDILLIVTGNVPELGTDLIESHWFRADTDISDAGFGEIAVDYPDDRKTWKASRKWKDWSQFDEPQQ